MNILKLKSKGPEVKALQKALGVKADGVFGAQTKKALIAYQLANGLNADGVFGPITAAQMGKKIELPPEAIPVPGKLKVPNGLKEIKALFGNPLENGFWTANQGFCSTPEELDHCFTYKNSKKENGFYCHKLLVPTMQKALVEIVKAGLADKLHTFSGCYNLRNTRGGSKLSTHSWGIAVDLNAPENPLGKKNPPMDKGVIEIFRKNGFKWGGDWSRPDGMHFQYCTGY